MFPKKIFCTRLKELRLEKNLTLKQLGSIFHVTKQTISRWETGDRIPSIEIVYMLSEYFNVSTDYLLGKSVSKTTYEIKNDNVQLTVSESELLKEFRTLDKYEQNIIKGKISEMIYNKNNNR
ncbi:helix-turn-helix domain-containing protein [Sedimentibacter sp. MB31-C6]|uniref:helix-turn-helix domain-containing protein n=1 Tax=Sedimentibacter sp. MB31-C6 TaxID=3109366 RepID=UPI002DDCECA8|nr:helix-turn-helix transcriptional regulator [Sedimentibacter sp. MB36-C1]WSI03571.1 helix-turn-helix transcriptional regulator [Sedimentibacter sp. MB36-C1]